LLKPSGGEGRWCVSRRSLKCKHISCLLIELGREIVFAGTHGDGIYAAEDQGRSWMRKDRGGEFPDIYSLNLSRVAASFDSTPEPNPRDPVLVE
jgi:hypothetical protein